MNRDFAAENFIYSYTHKSCFYEVVMLLLFDSHEHKLLSLHNALKR